MKSYNPNAEFCGKKILILGAHALMVHVIKHARMMGIYTIITDNVPNALAKKYADEAYDISTLDVDSLIHLAKEKKVDGIFTGYVDINLAPCAKVCEALGLPFYVTQEQLEQTMNKVNFKNNCRKYGISVVDDVPEEYLDGVYERVHYPVIVKPADGYSSKGISVCHNKEEMRVATRKAMEQSFVKQVLAESYIDIAYAQDVYLYFTVQEGYLSLSAMADRLMNDEQYGCAPQPVGYFFPSKHIDLYYEKVHDNLQHMITGLGIKNGSFTMQGFVYQNNIVFFEMNLRLSGGAGYLLIAKQNQIDQVTMYLRFALTGRFDGWDVKKCDDARFRKPACVLVILLRDGEIATIIGVDDVLRCEAVFDILQLKYEGDVLEAKGTLNQVFARIYMCAETTDEIVKAISYVKHTLKITDTNGDNMILNLFNEKEIY